MAAPAPVRECGTCTLCCKLLGIVELNKMPGTWCKHALPSRGCGIYADRPHSCRAFYCAYLTTEEMPAVWHPLRSKIVLVNEPGGGLTAVVDSGRPDAWKEPPYYQQLKAWSVRGLPTKRQVIVRIGKRTIALLPDRDVDLGPMEPGEQVEIEVSQGPLGPIYNARRAGGAPPAPDAAPVPP